MWMKSGGKIHKFIGLSEILEVRLSCSLRRCFTTQVFKVFLPNSFQSLYLLHYISSFLPRLSSLHVTTTFSYTSTHRCYKFLNRDRFFISLSLCFLLQFYSSGGSFLMFRLDLIQRWITLKTMVTYEPFSGVDTVDHVLNAIFDLEHIFKNYVMIKRNITSRNVK